MKYRTILCDPPWSYLTWSPKANRASAHYETQGTDWIMGLPVEAVAEKDCTLLLWAVNPNCLTPSE